MTDDTDRELVAGLRCGSREAAGRLAERYLRASRAVALAIAGDVAAAEDVAQDAFVALERKEPQVEQVQRLVTLSVELDRRAALPSGMTLERIRTLFPRPRIDDDRVTAASASPDGRWVGVRSYRRLYLYRADALLGQEEVEPITIDLSALGEAQGEALVLTDAGEVFLSSESANRRERPRWARLRCTFPDSPP